jgi:predicted nucleic acid-binding protein
MKSNYLLDSNIIIDFLFKRPKSIKILESISINSIPSTSPICIAEVQLGAMKEEIDKTNQFLDSLIVYDVTKEIANLSGKLIREYKKEGKTLNLIDTLIASTCIINGLILVTYNIKHYFIKDLKLLDTDKIL